VLSSQREWEEIDGSVFARIISLTRLLSSVGNQGSGSESYKEKESELTIFNR